MQILSQAATLLRVWFRQLNRYTFNDIQFFHYYRCSRSGTSLEPEELLFTELEESTSIRIFL